MLKLILLSALVLAVLGDAVLECLDDKMKLTFDKAQSVDAFSLLASGANCSPLSNDTVIEIGLDSCGTKADHNTTHIIYENQLTGTSNETASSLINRGSLLVMVLRCSYERQGSTTVLSWEAGQSVVNEEEEGVLTFTMNVYESLVTNALSNLLVSPFEVDLRETLYFAITLETANSLTLTIEIVDVIAMDSSDIDTSTANKYYIVQNGCAQDSTYQALSPTGDNNKRKVFSVEAFNFVSNSTAAVYIHGVVKICDTAESSYAACSAAPSCGGGRKRRNTELAGKQDQEFHVYGGPFFFSDPDQHPDSESQPSSVFMMQVPAVAITISQLLLLFKCSC